MRIVHIASELAPLAKVGGLADVVYGLSQELIRLGHSVHVILPKYDCLDKGALQQLKTLASFDVIRPGETISNTLFSATVNGLNVLLIEAFDPSHFMKRGCIYGCPDDIDRFLYFCQAALQALTLLDIKPDILHLHDWQTAAIAALQQEIPTILTIHNLQYQGKGSLGPLWRAGLPLEHFASLGELNLLKTGIEHATQVTTVSPHYQQEIETSEGGCGLQDTLQQAKYKLQGILNGIDAHFWDPENDPYIPFHYQTGPSPYLEDVLKAKFLNKKALCETLGLSSPDGLPLVAAITRLVPQKSPELLKHALRRTVEQGGLFILLGSSPLPFIQAEFEALQKECLSHANARIIMDHDEGLAHRIYAASDLFIIPSLFEPCGLTQLIALRYGSIPVARLTGGLADTVFDKDTSPLPYECRNGFTFDFPDPQGVDWALLRALDCYKHDKKVWYTLMRQGLHYDFTWKRSTPLYLAVYQRALRT